MTGELGSSSKGCVVLFAYAAIEMDPPLFNLARVLSVAGFDVHAVGISIDGQQARCELREFVTIHRSPYFSRSPMGSLLFAPALYLLECLKVVRSQRPAVMVATNWNSLLAASAASLLRLQRLIYYQTEYLERGREARTRWSLGRKVAFSLERLLARRVAALFSAEPHRSELMRIDYGLSAAPKAVYNCPVLHDPEIEVQTESENQIRFVYAGAIARKTRIIDLVNAVLRAGASISIDFYGSVADDIAGEFFALLRRACEGGHLLRYMGITQYGVLASVLRKYDVGIVLYRKEFVNQLYCSPGKLFEYVAAGLAVLASDNPGIEHIVKEFQLGLCCDADDPASIVGVLEELVSNVQFVQKCRRQAVLAHRSRFNYEAQSAPLLATIESIAVGANGRM